MGANRLPLTSTLVKDSLTNRFSIQLLNCAHRTSDKNFWLSNFKFQDDEDLHSRALTADLSDMLINGMSDPLKDDSGVPWRGPKEKDQSFFNTLILSLTKVGDVVVDLHAGTGNYVLLCFKFLEFFQSTFLKLVLI